MNPRGSVKGLDVVAIARSGMESAPLAEAQRSAFARVYEEHAQAIYRYLLARVGRGDLAEELTAQTFLAALQGFPKYRGTGTHLGWLIGIARRKAVDAHRQHRHERRPLVDANLGAAIVIEAASAPGLEPGETVALLGGTAYCMRDNDRQRLVVRRDGTRIEVQASLDLSREDLTKIAGSLVAIPR